jgi:hypothetical protein
MKTKFDTQRAKVAEYLKEGNTITARDAYKLCGTMRLSAIIHHLRHERGMAIADERVYEENTNYSKYWLCADPKLKAEMKDYMMRGNYMTTEIAEQVFECDYLNVLLNELKEEGLNIVSKRRKPLCGKEFTIWIIEK